MTSEYRITNIDLSFPSIPHVSAEAKHLIGQVSLSAIMCIMSGGLAELQRLVSVLVPFFMRVEFLAASSEGLL